MSRFLSLTVYLGAARPLNWQINFIASQLEVRAAQALRMPLWTPDGGHQRCEHTLLAVQGASLKGFGPKLDWWFSLLTSRQELITSWHCEMCFFFFSPPNWTMNTCWRCTFLIQKHTFLYYILADNLLILSAIGPGLWNFAQMDLANTIRRANACS